MGAPRWEPTLIMMVSIIIYVGEKLNPKSLHVVRHQFKHHFYSM
jgi:hypothetical protein